MGIIKHNAFFWFGSDLDNDLSESKNTGKHDMTNDKSLFAHLNVADIKSEGELDKIW